MGNFITKLVQRLVVLLVLSFFICPVFFSTSSSLLPQASAWGTKSCNNDETRAATPNPVDTCTLESYCTYRSDDTTNCAGNRPLSEVSKQYNLSDETIKGLINLIQGINFLITSLYMLLIPLILIVGKFLSNDWVLGGAIFNLDIVIELVWQMIRNMVNIGIVFYLLYMAGANIAGAQIWGSNIKQQVDIKTKLPMIAVALIVVNFSLFFCKQVLNIANITTSAAFSFPTTITGTLVDDKIGTITGGYNPFVWASPIPRDQIGKIQGFSGVGQTITQAKSGDYIVECLHRNYGLNLRGDDNKMPLVIANPGYSPSGELVVPASWNYRLYFSSPSGEKSSVLGEKTKFIETEKGKIGAYSGYTTYTDPGVRSTGQDVNYPYYSDCITSWDELAFSAQNAMFAYAFNIMRVQDFQVVLSSTKSFEDIVTKNILAAILLLFFLLVNLAMALAMIIRSVYLWIMMAISPLWMFLEISKIKAGGTLDKMMKQYGAFQFIKLAFMPTAVGMVLGVGFIMINYIKYVGTIEGGEQGRIPLGTINFIYDTSMPLIGGLTSMMDMVVALIGIGILWMGVFAALKVGMADIQAFKDWVEPINAIGTSVGKAAANLPTQIPFVPIPGKGMFTLGDVKGTMKMAENKLENFSKPTSENLNKAFGWNSGKDGDTYDKKAQEGLEKNIKDATTIDGMIRDINAADARHNSEKTKDITQKIFQTVSKLDPTNITTPVSVTTNGGVFTLSPEMAQQIAKALKEIGADPAHKDMLNKVMNEGNWQELNSDQKDFVNNKLGKEKLGVTGDIIPTGGTKEAVKVEDQKLKEAIDKMNSPATINAKKTALANALNNVINTNNDPTNNAHKANIVDALKGAKSGNDLVFKDIQDSERDKLVAKIIANLPKNASNKFTNVNITQNPDHIKWTD